jgi:hypothetical protein
MNNKEKYVFGEGKYCIFEREMAVGKENLRTPYPKRLNLLWLEKSVSFRE